MISRLGPGRRWLSPVLGFALGIGFCYAIAKHVDGHALWNAVTHTKPLWLAAAVGCALIGFTTRAVRWWLMLRTVNASVPFSVALRIFFASFGLNNVLPLRVGDVARAFGYTDVLHCDGWKIVGTLITERVLDLAALIAIGWTVMHLLPNLALPAGLWVVMKAAIAGVLLLILSVFALNRPLHSLCVNERVVQIASRARIIEGLRIRIMQVLHATASSSSLRLLPALLVLSAVGWLGEASVFVVVFAALKIPVTVDPAMLGFGFGTLATMLPGPPGYFGTYDFFAIQGLVLGGIANTSATAVTLLSHLAIWSPVTLLGLGALIGMPAVHRRYGDAAELETAS